MARPRLLVWSFFFLMLLAHGLWAARHYKVYAGWANVPPAPGENGMTAFTLGDRQFAYRATAIMLQNLGNSGGRTMGFHLYDYEALGRWFTLSDKMDPVSEYVPVLAAFYFSASQKPEQLDPVVDYLAMIGRRPEGQKWRWMAQAVYISRFLQGDLERAFALATELSAMWKPGRPAWMKQMPAFVMTAEGDKKAAYDILIRVLEEDADKIDPTEVNFMVGYICEKILTPQAAAVHPLCIDLKKSGR